MPTPLHESSQSLQQTAESLGPWFHNLYLPDGTQTAPDHFLGDFPRRKWLAIADHLPADLTGWSVLDVGCNGGFYSFELARRGAQVTAIDSDEHYLRQARWAAEQLGLQQSVTFRQQQVYSLADEDIQYDLVWFMGVFYHLRYPLLALDILARRTKRLMVFQTMTLPGDEALDTPDDVALGNRDQLLDPGWPKMAFIEKHVAGDPTNWWAANHACVEAMLRSSGLRVTSRPAHEIYVCQSEPESRDRWGVAELNDQQYRAAVGDRAGRRTAPASD